MISIMRDSIDIVPVDGSAIIRPSSMTAKRLFTECIADDTSKPFDFHAKNPYQDRSIILQSVRWNCIHGLV